MHGTLPESTDVMLIHIVSDFHIGNGMRYAEIDGLGRVSKIGLGTMGLRPVRALRSQLVRQSAKRGAAKREAVVSGKGGHGDA